MYIHLLWEQDYQLNLLNYGNERGLGGVEGVILKTIYNSLFNVSRHVDHFGKKQIF